MWTTPIWVDTACLSIPREGAERSLVLPRPARVLDHAARPGPRLCPVLGVATLTTHEQGRWRTSERSDTVALA
jgi:hypothetical protein